MDLRKLEAFCKVYELQSFSKAGDMMFLSQPTISSHVANLEEELGVKLFDRLGRSVMPTQAGNVLYGRAMVIFENLNSAKASIEELRDRVVGDLQIGCSTIPSHSILPRLVSEFSVSYPEVSFTVHTGDTSEVVKRVLNGDWPVGIVGLDPEDSDLQSYLIAEDETMVVASPSAPWLMDTDQELALEAVLALPWIMRERGSATRMALESALVKTGSSSRSLKVRCQVEGTCESLSHALNGVGVCFISRLVADDYLERGKLVQLKVPELEGRRKFYLIHHRGRYMFPALKAFVEFNK
ncbi:selenium metabolism-associated LysR family transcriptional regulator [Pseudodesulfovibrio sediminis]|uniref:LysR family transcriptional regulator n=1 Tax=Pseudodesulfovibrio sediminis TaxID=2810563 RepID=A0ABM7PB49_9BACT|nr:selenium metabolism-associated LysR family transcriptional regulator [Pseudodesulfovibrio sediminis]BCS90272.1 LysR family transcriptional regulator [Pseudodesulfovibrio sediminis]